MILIFHAKCGTSAAELGLRETFSILDRLRSRKSPRLRGCNLVVAGWVTVGLVGSAGALRAQSVSPPPGSFASSLSSAPFWANRGRWTFGAQLGFGLENNIPKNVSHIALLIAQPRLSFIVGEFHRTPVRSFSIVGEGILGNAVHPNGRFLGQTILFRIDGRPHGRVAPFFEFGGGALSTTLYKKVPELNGSTQFMPQGGIGIDYFFNPQRAFVIEYRYFHVSNANLVVPNPGVNGSMITVGFHWLRRPRPVAWQSQSTSHNPFRHLFRAD